MAQKKLKTMEDLLERVINDPEASIEKIESVHRMVEEERERGEKIEFNEALKEVQKDVSKVAADANNPQTRSKYATYGKLDGVLRPHYLRHGLSVSYNTLPCEIDETIRVEAIVSHDGGCSRSYTVDMPIVTTGIKGESNMTRTHAVAAAQSYGMRYLLKMIFNVAVGEDDDDGNGPAPLVREDQVKEINDLITGFKKAGGDTGAFMSWMSRELKSSSVEQLTLAGYERAKGALERRIAKQKKEKASA